MIPKPIIWERAIKSIDIQYQMLEGDYFEMNKQTVESAVAWLKEHLSKQDLAMCTASHDKHGGKCVTMEELIDMAFGLKGEK